LCIDLLLFGSLERGAIYVLVYFGSAVCKFGFEKRCSSMASELHLILHLIIVFVFVFVCAQVDVISAQGLPRMDRIGTADPYVELYTQANIVEETSVKKNTLTPVWNERIWVLVQEPDTQVRNADFKQEVFFFFFFFFFKIENWRNTDKTHQQQQKPWVSICLLSGGRVFVFG
jgi:hypothetical protein